MHKLYFILLIFSFNSLLGINYYQYISPELSPAVEKINQCKHAQQILQQASQAGPLNIRIASSAKCPFEGLWESSTRTIYVNKSKHNNIASQIQSIVFEMHNAANNNKLCELWKKAQNGAIDKDSFVESAERIEHANLCQTCQLIEQGIANGTFPPETRLHVITEFPMHYLYQQLADHSQWLGNEYDNICPPHMKQRPFKGSLSHLSTVSKEDKDDMKRYLRWMRGICSQTPSPQSQKAYEAIQNEFSSLNGCLANPQSNSQAHCHRAERRWILFQGFFKNIL